MCDTMDEILEIMKEIFDSKKARIKAETEKKLLLFF